MCYRVPDGHCLGLFEKLAVEHMSDFVAQFVSCQEIKHSGPVQTYIHERTTRNSAFLINFFSLALHPQFGPWPTSMKLSVSLRFSRS
jgi:hypothetical protein